MHRVNKKRAKTLTLRFTAYAITLLLTIFTTAFLLFVALGYRFNGKDGDVVRSGLLLVDSKPEAAQIFIGDELKDNAAPGRFILQNGKYNLGLRREGYRDWKKNVVITPSGVTEVNYPILVPQKLKPVSTGETFEAPSLVSQSNNRQYLLMHASDQPAMTLLKLGKDTPEATKLTLPSAFIREDGKTGTFKLIEWALDGKHVLLEQTLPSGTKQLMSFDIGKPADAVNISSLYGVEAPTDIHYVGGNTDYIYGIKDGLLRKQSLKTASIEIIIKDIRSYQPYGDDTLLYEAISPDETIKIGIMKNDSSRTIKKNLSPSIKHHLKYAQYDKHYYLVVAEENGSNVTLYRDPLDAPDSVKLTPFIILQFENTSRLTFSDSSQFIFAQNANKALSYDLRDLRPYRVQLPFSLAIGSTFEWIDGFHLKVFAEDGTGYMLDYDGQNLQGLVNVGASKELYFAPNMRSLYNIGIKAENDILEKVYLVTAADE